MQSGNQENYYGSSKRNKEVYWTKTRRVGCLKVRPIPQGWLHLVNYWQRKWAKERVFLLFLFCFGFCMFGVFFVFVGWFVLGFCVCVVCCFVLFTFWYCHDGHIRNAYLILVTSIYFFIHIYLRACTSLHLEENTFALHLCNVFDCQLWKLWEKNRSACGSEALTINLQLKKETEKSKERHMMSSAQRLFRN